MSIRAMAAFASSLSITNTSPASVVRKELLSQLLNCVKECQKRYGGKNELASEKDRQVSELCASLEAVLSHGLRSAPITTELQTSTLKQMSKLITGRLHLTDERQVFWYYVFLFLTPHERERYALLKNIKTDVGRGRAWIRGSLNERSLERYFHYMLESNELLHAHYEDWALMRDPDKSSMFPNMIAGLSSILFAINIDNSDLDSSDVETKSFLKNMKTEPVIITKIPEQQYERRQNRKVVKQIITFDDDDDDVGADDVFITKCDNKQFKSSVNNNIDNMLSINMDTDAISDIESGVQNISISQEGTEFVHNDKSTGLRADENCNIDEQLIPIESTTNSLIHDEVEIVVRGEDEILPESNSEDGDLYKNVELLKRENDKLKTRLRKYVSAIQLLNKNRTEAQSTLSSVDSIIFDTHDEVKQYEAKLIQIAEMHAELMEFNEYLQQQINFKDAVIQRLKKEIISNSQMTNSYEENAHLKGEVSISIPSAYLTGNGSNAHHVYQIHIRAGNHEWNIYRRYAHFHALHTQLKKLDPKVSEFKFPPKKTIGNKDKAIVEKRRKMLENYLRKLFEHWPELGACSSRAALEQYLAFFREPTKFEEGMRGNSQNRNLFSCSSSTSSSEIHYNGL